jgi:Fic family protein
MSNKKLSHQELEIRHTKLLDYQASISPFTATLREMQDVWGMGSTATVRYTLEVLVELGFVVKRTKGKTTQYYAV